MRRVFDDLSLFCAVVEQGSLKSASKMLGVPHSTVSRRIEALEQRLGLVLLHRTTRQINVSHRGRQLYEDCSPLLESLDLSVSLAVDAEVSFKGALKVTMPVRAGLDFLGGWLIDFASAHPDLKLDVSVSNEYLNLIRDDVDLAFRVGPLLDSSAIALHLWDIPYTVCATRGFIDKHGINPDAVAPALLPELPCVVSHPATNWQFIDNAGQELSIAPRQSLTVNDLGLAGHAIESGAFATLLPTEMLARMPTKKEVVALTIDGLTPKTRSMYAYYHGKRHASSQIKHIVDYIKQRRQQHQGKD